MPLEMHNQWGFELEVSRRALDLIAAEKKAATRTLYKRGAMFAVLFVGGGWALDFWLGTSRGFGAALGIVAFVITAIMLAWLLNEVWNV